MTIWRRVRLFLVGIVLGLIFVYAFFGDRDLDAWTPQSRVLAAIDTADVSIATKANCQLNCLNIEKSSLDSLYAKAKVDFSKSKTKVKPCPIYQLNTIHENQAVEMMVEVCERKITAELHSIEKKGVECDCP